MILTCPSCTTRYMADSASFLPSGRTVRCANCSTSWFQNPPDDLGKRALPNLSAKGDDTSSEITALTRKAGAFGLAQVMGWVLLIGTMIVIGLGATHYRVQIVRLWPQAATLYDVAGMPVNTRGLIFRRTTYAHDQNVGGSVLSVRGEIVNATNQNQIVPPIRVSLRDEEQRALFDWTVEAPVRELGPHESSPFTTYLDSPPAGAQDLVIVFEKSDKSATPN